MRTDAQYFLPPFEGGKPIESGVVFKVVDSKIPGVANGSYYSGLRPWVSPQLVTKEQISACKFVDPEILRKTKLGLGSSCGHHGHDRWVVPP
jgi:NADPH-dependent curcumin reductase CurA